MSVRAGSRGAAPAAAAVPRPRTRITGRAVVLLALMAALLLAAIYPLRTYFEQRGRIEALERQARELARENAGLEQRIERLGDPDYLERMARECLGMVKPGEIPFVVVPKHGNPKPLPC